MSDQPTRRDVLGKAVRASVLAGLGGSLRSGVNRLVLSKEGKGSVPYSVAVSYRSLIPAST